MTLAGLTAGSLDSQARPQAARLKVIRQQHDAIGIEPLRFQRINAPQHFVLLQVDHRDGPVAHAFQIEQAILDKEVPFIGRQHAMVSAGSGGDRFEKLRLLRIAVVVQIILLCVFTDSHCKLKMECNFVFEFILCHIID